jgi:Mlc titration factor MtfA (ptsG expression regulator)
MFSWLRNRRRRKLLAEPFPAEWLEYIQTHVPHFASLAQSERQKLFDDVRVFIAERQWEGCGSLKLSPEIQVAIAGQACLLTLGFDEGPDLFRRASTILVYPAGYRAPDEQSVGGHLTIHGESERLGEAWHRGPVILSWEDVRAGGTYAGDGHNLVFHEFAHVLDMLGGDSADGAPPLADRKLADDWRRVMQQELARLDRAIRHRQRTLLDDYGAESETEFFAVATECFFDAPRETRREYGELYELLKRIYRQDPAARLDGREAK